MCCRHLRDDSEKAGSCGKTQQQDHALCNPAANVDLEPGQVVSEKNYLPSFPLAFPANTPCVRKDALYPDHHMFIPLAIGDDVGDTRFRLANRAKSLRARTVSRKQRK